MQTLEELRAALAGGPRGAQPISGPAAARIEPQLPDPRVHRDELARIIGMAGVAPGELRFAVLVGSLGGPALAALCEAAPNLEGAFVLEPDGELLRRLAAFTMPPGTALPPGRCYIGGPFSGEPYCTAAYFLAIEALVTAGVPLQSVALLADPTMRTAWRYDRWRSP